MARLRVGLTPQIQSLLEDNGIDWRRCSSVQIDQSEPNGPTMITVTMFAVQEELPTGGEWVDRVNDHFVSEPGGSPREH